LKEISTKMRDKKARGHAKNQRPCLVWFTGISGSGKTTVARLVEEKLWALGKHSYLLDGDILRKGLCKDLGYDDSSRVENIRRAAEVAAMMVDAGLIVLAAFISPFLAERELARSLVGNNEFLEVHMDTALEIAEQRDPKGLYKKARRGEMKDFTGIDSPYETPTNPEIRLIAGSASAEEMADQVVDRILGVQGLNYEV
jgi:bifunctional enzyme CysN/CysC